MRVSKLPQHYEDLVDHLERITTCLEAVETLTIPCEHMHAVHRDSLAVLLGFLRRNTERPWNGFMPLDPSSNPPTVGGEGQGGR